VLVWILAGCLVGALVLAAALWLALTRARTRVQASDELVAAARSTLREAVEEETTKHAEEIRRVLARERAESISALAAEERKLTEAHRGDFAARERHAGELLAATLAEVERKVEERLRSFTDDLDRSQRHVETQLARLEQRHREAIADVEQRIAVEAADLGSTADEQRKAVSRLREELERAAGQAVTEALDELESHTAERRRAIADITERLRARETALAEVIERAESDARGRLEVEFVEFERRQTDRISRVLERELERHVQVASLAFDERMRDLREESAARLARELDRAVELLGREELIRRIETEPPTNRRQEAS
jgi:hypothetical protein